jgi:hypothetical protein
MPFVNPNSADDPNSVPVSARRDRVSVEWSDTPVPLSEAVEAHDGLLLTFSEQAATRDELRQLADEVESLRENLGRLERIVDVLAAASPLGITGECPECDGELVAPTGDDAVACGTCGYVAAYFENPS